MVRLARGALRSGVLDFAARITKRAQLGALKNVQGAEIGQAGGESP